MHQPAPATIFAFDNSYVSQLPDDFYVRCQPASFPEPSLLRFNRKLAEELGVDLGQLDDDERVAALFSGNELPAGADPIAQAYAGHQFGGFVPQLGDGRALLLGEVIDLTGQRRDIAFKGSGPTPFSRGGDGKAAVGPVLREYLIGEAMHGLKVPTTRALAAVATGETVYRERRLPGAVLTRVAASHLRVGTFEFFAARRRFDLVQQLADYTIDRHYPDLKDEPDRYLRLLSAVAERQAALVAEWMHVGFIHGVMNTDNMALSGETIDYGPCAFLEAYSPRAVFSSIDMGGRYAFGNQPLIACWNLARLGETLLPLIADPPEQAIPLATEVVHGFMPHYEELWLDKARVKLGFDGPEREEDRSIVQDWFALLEEHEIDFTLAWRRLADASEGNAAALAGLFPAEDALRPWLDRWSARVGETPDPTRAARMRATNPIYIPRNHLVEQALTAAAEDQNLEPMERLLDVLSDPYTERSEIDEQYADPAPQAFTACYKTFCGT